MRRVNGWCVRARTFLTCGVMPACAIRCVPRVVRFVNLGNAQAGKVLLTVDGFGVILEAMSLHRSEAKAKMVVGRWSE